MALAHFMRDTLSLVKRDGSRTDGLKGNVQKDKIFIHRNDIVIGEGDVLIRSMPHGGVEEYIVVEPNFRQGLGSIPAGYQAEVRRKTEATPEHVMSSTSAAIPESVISLIQSFISLCITVVNEDASHPEKHVTVYHTLRQKILELDNVMTIPSWIRFSQTPAAVKNSVGLYVQGGSGGWDRRRQYLQSEMINMLSSYNNLSFSGHSVSQNTIKTTEQISGLTTMGSDSVLNMKRKFSLFMGMMST